MSSDGLEQARQKMMEAGSFAAEAIDVFAHYYGELESGATGLISEDTIDPLTDPPTLSEIPPDHEAERAALAQTAIIKLNGGLGTSMGMEKASRCCPSATVRPSST